MTRVVIVKRVIAEGNYAIQTENARVLLESIRKGRSS